MSSSSCCEVSLCLHIHDHAVKETGYLFDPEYEGARIFRNVGHYLPNGRELHPRRHESSLQFNVRKLERVRGMDGWLRHCATSRQVAGLIPFGVIVVFL